MSVPRSRLRIEQRRSETASRGILAGRATVSERIEAQVHVRANMQRDADALQRDADALLTDSMSIGLSGLTRELADALLADLGFSELAGQLNGMMSAVASEIGAAAARHATSPVIVGADGGEVTVGAVIVVVDDEQRNLSDGVPGAWLVDNLYQTISRVRSGRYGIVESIGAVNQDDLNQPNQFPGLGALRAQRYAQHFAEVALINDGGEVTSRGRLYLHNIIAPNPLSATLNTARRLYVKNNPDPDARLFDFKVDGRSLYEFEQSELEELVVALDWHLNRQKPKTA